MVPFTQLINLDKLEKTIETRKIKSIQWNSGFTSFQSEIGEIQIQYHRGFQIQVHQRTEVWLNDRYPWNCPHSCEAVKQAITHPNTEVRLVPIGPRKYKLYGLINPHCFRPTDKAQVRAAFHQVLQAHGIDTSHPEYSENRYRAPLETFCLPNGRHTSAKITLQYGFDNGVSAYKLWLDDLQVLICGNRLVLPDEPYEWQHLAKREPIEDFLHDKVSRLLERHAQLNQNIDDSMSAGMPASLIEDIVRQSFPNGQDSWHLRRIAQLVRQQYQQEVRQWGESIWAVSQTLSNVGTHQLTDDRAKALQKMAAKVLTDFR